MSLITAKYLTAANDTALQFNTEAGWQAVSRGLRLIITGYVVLLGGTALGWFLIRWGLADGPLVRLSSAAAQDRDLLLLMAVLTLGMTAVFSYGMVLVGQWHCLMYSPQAQHAKELMYVCFNCLLMASLLNALGAYLDGGQAYAALREGADGLDRLDLWSAGNLLQLASAVLGLLAALVFSGYLRTVVGCFRDSAKVRRVDLSLWLMGLLLGGSVGALFCVQRLSFRAQSLPWLVGGWLLCFALHLYAVGGAYRCVQGGLRRGRWAGPSLRQDPGAAVGVRSLSGLHRLAKKAQN
ncbi:MAG TPA: hypothetical protein VFE78_33600 [Gemmataceae bacterium]|nr:hypothetical protein [Gemmataceae bacterium]